MTTNRHAADILDRDFLAIRHEILNVAAALDRIDRGDTPAATADDPRMTQIRSALRILAEPETGRAQRVQMTFSRPYVANEPK